MQRTGSNLKLNVVSFHPFFFNNFMMMVVILSSYTKPYFGFLQTCLTAARRTLRGTVWSPSKFCIVFRSVDDHKLFNKVLCFLIIILMTTNCSHMLINYIDRFNSLQHFVVGM